MANVVTVRPTADDRRVLLVEFDAEHPDGEAFVYNDPDQTFRVAKTAKVVGMLRGGDLEEVDTKRGRKKAADADTGGDTGAGATGGDDNGEGE